MATLNELVQDFLAQREIAVVGVSDQRETGCNAVYRKFKEAGYHVRVWMHCMLGTKPGLAASLTSVSPAAVQMCQAHGITVIPGACPNQFLKPDFGHGLMRVLFRSVGFHQLAQG